MKRKVSWWPSVVMLLLLAAPVSVAQSTGNAAPAPKDKQNSSTKKATRVYTNDDFPSGNAEPAPPTPPENPASPGASTLLRVPTVTGESSTGVSVPLSPDNATTLIFMASWCPHCKALKNILNDPHSRPYWAKNKLLFLFPKDEWEIAKSNLEDMAKEGKIKESDVPALLERAKNEAGSPYVLHPNALDELPGDYYFCTTPKEVNGYPTVLSAHGYTDRRDWLVNDLKMPDDLFEQLEAKYDSEGPSPPAK